MPSPICVQRWGSSSSERVSTDRITWYSSESASVGAGTAPTCSYSVPLCTSSVASPPSSRIMFGPGWAGSDPPSGPSCGQRRTCSVHHQYSSSVSPFHAYTGTPCGSSGVPSGPTAIAAAAWSWVEKMLQLHQRTSAPRAVSVSISTAVWIVMCSEPVIRAPFKGCASAYSARIDIRPGISCSASVISLRPNSASERSATLKSALRAAVGLIADMTSSPIGHVSALATETGRAWRITQPVAALLGRPGRYHTGIGRLEASALGERRLQLVENFHRSWVDPPQGREVDRHEIAQQHERDHPLDRRLPARLQVKAGGGVARDQPLGQLHALLDPWVGVGVIQEHCREASELRRSLP